MKLKNIYKFGVKRWKKRNNAVKYMMYQALYGGNTYGC